MARSPADRGARNGTDGPLPDHRQEAAASKPDGSSELDPGGDPGYGINLADPEKPPPEEVRPPSVVPGIAERLLAAGSKRRIAAPDDPNVSKWCPFLWELLTLTSYADGTTRALPSIKIERVSGGYSVSLQDHASHQQCKVHVQRLQDLAKTLEAAFAEGRAEWTEYRSYVVRDPRKRAKAEGS